METITVRNRKLEQCLYNLGEDWISCEKDSEGLTYWTFKKTPEAEWIADHFERSYKRRKEERERET